MAPKSTLVPMPRKNCGNNIRRGGIPFRPFFLPSPPLSSPVLAPSPYPVLDLLHAHRVSHKLLRNNMLNLFAIRTRFAPSVRKSALPTWGEGISFVTEGYVRSTAPALLRRRIKRQLQI